MSKDITKKLELVKSLKQKSVNDSLRRLFSKGTIPENAGLNKL